MEEPLPAVTEDPDPATAVLATDPVASPRWLPVVMVLPAIAIIALAFFLPLQEVRAHQGDVELYRRAAADLLHNKRLYVDVLLPYPPIAAITMAVPAVLWPLGNPSMVVYKNLFGIWEAVLWLGLAITVRRLAVAAARDSAGDGAAWRLKLERDSTIRLAILGLLTLFPLAFRYDLFPTLLATAGLFAAIDERPIASGVALAFGIMAKLFPVVFVPVAGLRWLLSRPAVLARFGVAVVVAAALVATPFVLLSGTAMSQVLGYQGDRPLQLESVGSSVALVVGALGGPGVRVTSGFGSVNIAGQVAQVWLTIDPWLTLAVILLIAFVTVRLLRSQVGSDSGTMGPRLLVHLATPALLGLLVTNKVFSMQYVVWLVPLAALLRWRQFAVVAVACALTVVVHPFFYGQLMGQEAPLIAVLATRNALLAGLLGWLLVDLWRLPARHKAGSETWRDTTPVGRWWRARRDSNPRPSGPQPDALSAELRALGSAGGGGGIRTLEAGYPT
jgi:hypothetical protein